MRELTNMEKFNKFKAYISSVITLLVSSLVISFVAFTYAAYLNHETHKHTINVKIDYSEYFDKSSQLHTYFITITFCFYQVFPNSFSIPFDLTLALINIIIPQIFCIFFVTTSNVLANKFQYFFTNLQINKLKLISFVQVMYFSRIASRNWK